MYYATEKTGYAVKNVSLTEGKRMTMLMCGSCHYNPATKDFSGKKLEDAPGTAAAREVSMQWAVNDLNGQWNATELEMLQRTFDRVLGPGRLCPVPLAAPGGDDE